MTTSESFVGWLIRKSEANRERLAVARAKAARGEKVSLEDFLPAEEDRPKASDKLFVIDEVAEFDVESQWEAIKDLAIKYKIEGFPS